MPLSNESHRKEIDDARTLAYSLNDKRSQAALIRRAAHVLDNAPDKTKEDFQADYIAMRKAKVLETIEAWKNGDFTDEQVTGIIEDIYSDGKIEQLPYYDLRVGKLVLQNASPAWSNADAAHNLRKVEWAYDRQAHGIEDNFVTSDADKS